MFDPRLIEQLKKLKPTTKPRFYKCEKCGRETLEGTPCPYHEPVTIREGKRIFVRSGLI